MAYKLTHLDHRQIAHFRRCSMTDRYGWQPVSLADDDDEEEGDEDEDDDE
jgi:hypothetical protein